MKALQFQSLLQAVTGRPLTLKSTDGEIPLESTVSVYRPYKDGESTLSFSWKTPKNEDALLRSFITAFCLKYLEPDPETYNRNCSMYGDTWERHAESWDCPETRWNCSPWHHHRCYKVSKKKLRAQVVSNFESFDAGTARLGFYETNYGIGIFTLFGGAWVKTSLASMAAHLAGRGIPFGMEMSEKEWVTRFVIGLEKPIHAKILRGFQ